jgi:mannose-6-phosphate isomerase-like protein (cupin superfamily)
MDRPKLPRPKGYEKYTFPFIVEKPWGREEWLELFELEDGTGYCYKRIYINNGEKTSFQYHERKIETNYIIEGKAEIWLENNQGKIEKRIMYAGDSFTVIPPRKHRVIALTDIILQEVSTPEVDDVIRIQDDTGRSSGRINSEHKR